MIDADTRRWLEGYLSRRHVPAFVLVPNDRGGAYPLEVRRAILPVPHVGTGARWTMANIAARGPWAVAIGAGFEDKTDTYPRHVFIPPQLRFWEG